MARYSLYCVAVQAQANFCSRVIQIISYHRSQLEYKRTPDSVEIELPSHVLKLGLFAPPCTSFAAKRAEDDMD
jgi:hypothetical protein